MYDLDTTQAFQCVWGTDRYKKRLNYNRKDFKTNKALQEKGHHEYVSNSYGKHNGYIMDMC
jgi:hypothetical protein